MRLIHTQNEVRSISAAPTGEPVPSYSRYLIAMRTALGGHGESDGVIELTAVQWQSRAQVAAIGKVSRTPNTMLDPLSILERYVTDQLSDWDVIGWANGMLAELSPSGNPALEQLANLDPQAVVDPYSVITRHLIALIPRATALTPEQVRLAHYARLLLNGDIAPFAFCQQVWELDSKLVNTDHYPDWLSDLWNACDWCDDAWTLNDALPLKKAAEELVSRPS